MANTWKIKRGDTELITIDQYDRHDNPIVIMQCLEVETLTADEAVAYSDALANAADAADEWAANNPLTIKAEELKPDDYFEDAYGKHEVHRATIEEANKWHSQVVVSFKGVGAGYYAIGQPVRLIRRPRTRG